jgi:hypothetical protein
MYCRGAQKKWIRSLLVTTSNISISQEKLGVKIYKLITSSINGIKTCCPQNILSRNCCYLIMGWSDDPSFVLMPVVPFTQLLPVEKILHSLHMLKQCIVYITCDVKSFITDYKIDSRAFIFNPSSRTRWMFCGKLCDLRPSLSANVW